MARPKASARSSAGVAVPGAVGASAARRVRERGHRVDEMRARVSGFGVREEQRGERRPPEAVVAASDYAVRVFGIY